MLYCQPPSITFAAKYFIQCRYKTNAKQNIFVCWTMNSRDTKIQNILKDYSRQQQDLEEKLLECRSSRYETQRKISEKVSRDKSDSKTFKVTPEEAHERNRQLLQDLESVKAKLRTIASFTPTDQELLNAARIYRNRMRIKNQEYLQV